MPRNRLAQLRNLGMPRHPSFTCDDLWRAMLQTNYGSHKEIAKILRTTEIAIQGSLQPTQRCKQYREVWRRGRYARLLEIRRRRIVETMNKLELQGRARKGYVPNWMKAEQESMELHEECRRFIKAIEKHGTFEGAARELGMSTAALRSAFFVVLKHGRLIIGRCFKHSEKMIESLTATQGRH